MNRRILNLLFWCVFLAVMATTECNALMADEGKIPRPNIVLILTDDLGYGDVGSYNPRSRVPTPNLDALAKQGMRFTDAHAPAAICTPSRYGLITGRYPWRGSWRKGTLKGEWYQGKVPALIEPNLPTLPAALRTAGYRTALVGKWHLGGYERDEKGQRAGVLAAGFEEDLLLWSKGEAPQDHVTNFREFDARVAAKTISWLEERSADASPQPFFLQVCPVKPHDPWIALEAWRGRSAIGSYGDVIMQLDAHIGAIVETLERTNLAQDTLLVVTSDNGPESARRDYSKPPFEVPDDIDDRINITERLKRFGHDSAGSLRGTKYTAYEGGHRVPFIVRWPGMVPAGSVSDRLLSLTDLFATFCAAAGVTMPAHGAEDSVDQTSIFRDPVAPAPRVDGIFASDSVRSVCVRSGSWTLIDRESSWWRELLDDPKWELYDLTSDSAQTRNKAVTESERAAKLRALRKSIEYHRHQ